MARSKELTWILAAIAALMVCCQWLDDEPRVAWIKVVQGEVTWRAAQGTPERAARAEQALVEGNIVATGADGSATVAFDGGNNVDLESNTTMVIRKTGASAAKVGAVLLAGSAKASSAGRGILLAIGTPFGLTEVGATESSLSLSLEKGIEVLVGQVTLLTDEGQKTLTAGMTVGGLEIRMGCESDDECETGYTCHQESHQCEKVLELAPMEFFLLSNSRQTQIKRSGTTSWKPTRNREVLARGDAVRTRKGSGTKVQFGELAALTLGPRTEMVFKDAGSGEAAHRAKYGLVVGNVIIHLDQQADIGSQHEISAGGVSMQVEPGLQEAAVEVTASEKGKAQVKVRLGRVVAPDGTVIDAGKTVTVENGAVASEAQPLARTLLDLRPGSSAIVYYSSQIPPVQFVWEGEEGATSYDIEVAKDRQFKKTVFRERLTQSSFVYDRFPPGRYHWRVKGTGDWARGVLAITKKNETDIDIRRVNQVFDTGEKTVIYYQKSLPALQLVWKKVGGAAKYRVRVYPDGEFDNPMVDEVVKDTKKDFARGKFGEGKYYWHQVALSSSGEDITVGKMNTLQIAYDNAIVDLSIKSPKSWQKTTSRSITTYGEVQLGAKLAINGKRTTLDRKGRFRTTLKLAKGVNQFVYRTISSDGVERYYVRQVIRR